MGVSNSKKEQKTASQKNNKNEKSISEKEISNNFTEDEKCQLKKLMFLIAQQNELKLKKVPNNLKEKSEFYIINETIEKYNANFKIDEIFKFFKDSGESLTLEKFDEDFEDIFRKIEEYCDIKSDSLSEAIENKKNTLDFFWQNNIKYPSNFFLIEKKYFSEFLNIFEEEPNNHNQNLYNVFFIEDYILIDYNKESSQYLACSNNDNRFNVDFIFIKEIIDDQNYSNLDFISSIKDFLKNEKNNGEPKNKNEKKILNNEKGKIGYAICYPENDIIKNEESESESNEEIYSKIKQYFDICSKQNKFLLELNNIKNYENDDIKEIISSQKAEMSEFHAYAIDEDNYKKILDRIYYTEYIKHSNADEDEKKEIITNIQIKEKVQKDKLEDLPNKILLHNEIKNNISLIDIDFYKTLFNRSENTSNEHQVNLIKINNEYYLYFKKNKQALKIYRINNENNWSIDESNVLIKQNLNVENNKNKGDLCVSTNIIKKLFLISFIRKDLKKKSKSSIVYEENYSLVDTNWLNSYKSHYNMPEIIRKCTNIDTKIKDNYDDFKKYLDSKLEKNNENKYKLKRKFPDKLKNPINILPKTNNIFNDYEYPIHFEIIKKDLFNKLIKEDDINDSYDIQIKENNDYNIIFEDNIIILIVNSNNTHNLYVYNNINDITDTNLNYKIKYIFQFNDSNILKKQIDILKTKNINNYIDDIGLDLTTNMEEITDKNKNSKIGIFINPEPEILTIDSFKSPPLIGLVNVGATCYMNATLQCFSNIDILTDFFLRNKNQLNNPDKYDLGSEYLKLILNLWNKKNKKKFYEPHDFKKKIGEKNPLFSGVAANDSKDLILFILETLHKELNRLKDANKNNNNDDNGFYGQISNQTNEKEEHHKFRMDYYSMNDSIISQLFYGEQESFSHCYNCQKYIYSFNIFNQLIFPLEKVRQYLMSNNMYMNGYVTLKDCFDHYKSIEVMSGPNQMYCNLCRVTSDFSMSNIIFKHPEVFIIILNRGKGLQYQVPFKYPISFILNDYINMNNNNDNYKNNEYIEYELISVITHIGESSMSGHFIACCKSPVDQNWYNYNDAIVTKCADPLNILGVNSSNSIPYVLFYQIKNKNPKKFNYNVNPINNEKTENYGGELLILYFHFKDNGKELYLDDVKDNLTFEEVINILRQKFDFNFSKKYIYKRGNGKKIDPKKTIKENGIKNEEKIIILTKED